MFSHSITEVKVARRRQEFRTNLTSNIEIGRNSMKFMTISKILGYFRTKSKSYDFVWFYDVWDPCWCADVTTFFGDDDHQDLFLWIDDGIQKTRGQSSTVHVPWKIKDIREGAKFIGLHQGQQGGGGLRVFGRKKMTRQTPFLKKKMTGQTLFWAKKKMTGLGLFYRKRMTGRKRFMEWIRTILIKSIEIT